MDDNKYNEWLSKTKNELPLTEDDAKARYQKYSNTDPYPKITPALLNSRDIYRYVCSTGMIFPFIPADHLKGASYEVCIGGEVVYWDEKGKEHVKELKNKTDKFTLLPNSIAFVTLEPYFQIPHYIALRFNLKISHIYKGLLLGTGPLVDPGFQGKLSIPLHNLTANEYVFKKGDGLIQLEFTKLSNERSWRKSQPSTSEIYQGFNIPNDIKPGRTVHDYIEKALENNKAKKVISSIPDAMHDSQKSAKSAKRSAKSMAIVSIITALITAATIVYSVISLTHDIKVRMSEIDEKINTYIQQNNDLRKENEELSDENENLLKQIDLLEETSPQESTPVYEVSP